MEMVNEFTQAMSERTNEELIKIVTVEKDSYQPLAIEAAEAEITKRNIDTTNFEKIRKKVTIEKKQKEKVESNVVGSGIRFVNFIIDFFVWLILSFVVVFLVGFVFQLGNQSIQLLIEFVLIFATFIAYFSIMEIKYQKTLGKFLTKTKVVNINSDKPNDGEIITRTICRLIPFDRLSFLFVKNGLHDYLSKTMVVKDSIE